MIPEAPAAFLAGELLLPGTDSCFFTAGGVEDSLWKGRTGCIGADLEPMERGSVWLFERGALGVLFPGMVSFFPEAEAGVIGEKLLEFV